MSSKAPDEILFHHTNNTGVITLNRPKALNALNLSMVRKMYDQMKKWEDDPKIGLVLIKGEGEKSFCAGGDIRAVTEAGRKGDSLAQDFFKEEYILNHKIGNYKKPYVALIDGITMGGGVGLSVHGMFRVATERTMFAMPETGIGLFPDVGGGHFLPQLEGKLGIFLALTGFRLKGRDVQSIGIATHFIDSSKVSELEKRLTNLNVDAGKEGVAGVLNELQSQSQVEADKEFILKPHVEQINRLFSGQTMEKIFEALQKDESDWAKKQLDILKKMSPISLKITLRLLLEGKNRSLAEDLKIEYRLSQRCLEEKDFYEGVRAVLIDKDNNPQWNPANIKDVPQSKVEWFFSPLDAKRELNL
ncbi:3-hydroxyisobutyryl-CoA hydrolase, mitochondrial-like isoform X2 [Physella acuta]|nr:3-hydroxyisobutyryl-CoA hydrolase, mitochondrial-like isoform X2 [Physella acuta]